MVNLALLLIVSFVARRMRVVVVGVGGRKRTCARSIDVTIDSPILHLCRYSSGEASQRLGPHCRKRHPRWSE